jgi:PAS domain S-box-containing protein
MKGPPGFDGDDGLDALLGRVRDVVFRYRIGPERGFAYLSPAVEAMTGYAPTAFYEDPELVVRIVHAEDRGLLAGWLAGHVDGSARTVRCVRRDGSVVWVEHRTVAVHGHDGRLHAVEGVAREIPGPRARGELVAGDVEIHFASQRVEIEGRAVHLTPAEFRLLALLAARQGPVDRDELASAAADGDPAAARSCEPHVCRLRRKLGAERIQTVRGVGYELVRAKRPASAGGAGASPRVPTPTERLYRCSRALAALEAPADLARVVLREVADLAGAPLAAVYLVSPEDGAATLVATRGFATGVLDPFRRVAADATVPVAEVARTGQPRWVPSTRRLLPDDPTLGAAHLCDDALLRAFGRQGAVLPLVAAATTHAVLVLGFTRSRSLQRIDRRLLATLLEQGAESLARARRAPAAARA